ncbi:MAG: alpha/beta fold hydrolase [Myxococcota bacterium]
MPPVLARLVYLGAALLFVASVLAIRSGQENLHRYAAVLGRDVPAVVYEPRAPLDWGETARADRRFPVVVLAHGALVNKGIMAVLARRLAHAGYAVVTFDFQGHGWNRNRLRPGWPGEALEEDIAAAVRYAVTRPQFDAERLVLAGHSTGAGAVLRYASRNPGAAAVVAVSGGEPPLGPYAPPNTLLVWATGDPVQIRERGREVGAKLAGLERLVMDRTYGDPQRGTAVRISEVGGTDTLTILYSADAARRIVRWLDETLGVPEFRRERLSNARIAWAPVGLLSAVVLLFGLLRLMGPHIVRQDPGATPTPERLLLLLIAHLVALLLMAGIDPRATAGSPDLLPVSGGATLGGFFALSSVGFGLLLLARRVPLPRPPRGPDLLGAGVILLVGYALFVSPLFPLLDLRLAPHRVPWALVLGALTTPFYLIVEEALRGDGQTARWISPVGRLVTLGFIMGGTMLGILPPVLLLATGVIVLLFALFEILSLRLARLRAGPWITALVHGGLTGWVVAALLPIV